MTDDIRKIPLESLAPGGASANDLATFNGTDWIAQSVVVQTPEFLHVRDEKASGTDAGSSIIGTQTRVLNTIKKNTITGASLLSNQLTLPAGTYKVRDTSVPAIGVARFQSSLYDTTGGTTLIEGSSEYTDESILVTTRSFISGEFTLSVESVLELRHYTQKVKATFGLGANSGSGLTEVYSEIIIEKVG